MSDLPKISNSASLKEQSASAIKILEYQIRFLNKQLRLRHKDFDLHSIQILWENKREATKHLITLQQFSIKE